MRILRLALIRLGLGPLLRGHRRQHRFEVDQRLAVLRLVHRALHALEAGHHAGQRAEAAHALHLLQLHAQVVEVELALGHLGRELFGILDLDGLGGALDQADDVAHAEDAAGDAAGVERLDRVEALAVPANLIGLPVTARIDSAAPPRASPSMRVRITPVRSIWSAKPLATLTASWPVRLSTTSRSRPARG
jgi:hypothetical protein